MKQAERDEVVAYLRMKQRQAKVQSFLFGKLIDLIVNNNDFSKKGDSNV